MNAKKFLLAGVGVFVYMMITDFIIHGLILKGCYSTPEFQYLWRPAGEMINWLMWVSRLIFSFVFVFIFTKGYEQKGLAEGLRFGLYIALLLTLTRILMNYATQPISFSLAIYWFVLETIQLVIAGLVAAAIYRPAMAEG
ncbi:hypothetical protein DRQ00_01700 [candidate division KSB1 bacterium]|nr:MAG: hypothetical protein DRQ00_01700 [candidate division KSB1 bacterium]